MTSTHFVSLLSAAPTASAAHQSDNILKGLNIFHWTKNNWISRKLLERLFLGKEIFNPIVEVKSSKIQGRVSILGASRLYVNWSISKRKIFIYSFIVMKIYLVNNDAFTFIQLTTPSRFNKIKKKSLTYIDVKHNFHSILLH